ncbi:glycosyltransferase family 2 protein [Streptomyces hokutonensis]|uniref:glycosyltransferase family 2 protein n=1 Tax=Streptomyces hokutonensis TaxID=1306990 RepID=UPI00036125B3|nr:glycosyltransferase [Streptomyces hokutonensis]
MQPELSVIIPFYCVERYFGECLESVAGQTLRDLQVIMVDDGSTDGSGHIAEKYARCDPRFQLIRQRNRGLGAARNTGLQEIRGRYIAFADSDDILAPDAYELLVGVLEESGSDISCGGVQRFNRDGFYPSSLHEGIFDEEVKGTHITRQTKLLGDRTVWNKVYRRSFWDDHGLIFPEHQLEDACVTVPAHVLATSVDIVTGPVYFWRHRDDGPPSITQRLFDLDIIEGRMSQVTTVSEFLATHDAHLKEIYDLVALEHDILILVMALPHVADPAYRQKLMRYTKDFLAGVDPCVMDQLGENERLCYRILQEGSMDEILRFVEEQPRTAFL